MGALRRPPWPISKLLLGLADRATARGLEPVLADLAAEKIFVALAQVLFIAR